MTVAEAKHMVVKTAQAELGYHEGSNNYNKYAAELDPMKVTWGAKQNQPWCAMFVLWTFYKCFGITKALEMLCSPNPTGIPLCSMGAGYFKNAKRWFNIPEKGDIVFFTYDGGINHTGIVVGVGGGVITCVEGNSGDSTRQNSYSTGSSIIAGYGRPKWDLAANEPEKPVEQPKEPVIDKPFELPMLKRGDVSEAVRAAQFLLNGRGASCGIYGADADFGVATEAAVLAFQRRNSLEADGIIGEQTWSALLGLQ